MALNAQTFSSFIVANQLYQKDDSILVAISGGLDSVVLSHLLSTAQFHVVLAHVNYGLRGDASEADENFVRAFAKNLGIELKVIKVDMEKEMLLSKNGIQETARNVRYAWLNQLRVEISAKFILTAHHKDDQAETVIHQWTRGGGLAALRGMKLRNQTVIRPLLNFSRAEINSYALANSLQWREDASNATDDYTRNFIRHKILPALTEINPNIVDSIAQRTQIFDEAEQLVHDVIAGDILKFVRKTGHEDVIELNWLRTYRYRRLLLWQLLEPKGFSSFQVVEVLKLMESQSGARVCCEGFCVWKENELFVIAERIDPLKTYIEIEQFPFRVMEPIQIDLHHCGLADVFFDASQEVVFLDAKKISGPVVVRSWKDGDYFTPLGMKGKQKVSDFLVQEKIARRNKNDVYVLEVDGVIAAIIGKRISEDFKITSATSEALRIAIPKM